MRTKQTRMIWALAVFALPLFGAAWPEGQAKEGRRGPPPELKMAVDSCAAELGIEHKAGERRRLDDATRAAMKACRAKLKSQRGQQRESGSTAPSAS